MVSSPTKTASLSSLSGNTDYTWKAYSDSACTNANELASEDFLTEPGQPGQPTVTAGSASGELKLAASVTGSGTISKWQYKRKVGGGSFDADWSDISNSGSTSLSHTFTGLTDGTNYQYKVRAVNATGESAESAASTAVAPLGETLTASGVTHNSATLTIANWSGDWYHKRTTPSTPTPTCSSVVSSPTKTASLSSLSGNTDYTWKAYSDSGCTNANELASEDFLTKPGKPGKPTVAAGSASGELKLTASVTGSGTISKWQYKRKVGGGSFDQNWSDISNSGSTSLSHTFTGLTDGTNYQYKVRAENATGFSAESAASTAVAPLSETLTASSVTHNSATLTIANWSGNWYHKRTSGTGGTCSSVVSSPTTTASLSSLSGNTDYTWKAYSDSNCTNANELASEDFLTEPGKPGQPTVAAGSASGELKLAASVTGSGTISKWQYKRKVGGGSFDADWSDISNSGSTSLSHTFTGLTDGTNYQYKVRAVNATGESAESAASTAVAPLGETLTASGVTHNSATLTIANWSGDWYHKRTTPSTPTPTCSSVVSSPTKTASLSSLSGNTDYTWKAYSDSGCTNANELASEDFLTKPESPESPPSPRARPAAN